MTRSFERSSAARALAMLAALALAFFTTLPRAAQEVHGTSDAFAGNGVAIAWGMLRGASEETTLVVMRVAYDPGRVSVSVENVDPFTRERKAAGAPRVVANAIEFRIPRKQFADFPRTELLLFAANSAKGAVADVVVYYLGVPDTTPEFPNEAALDAYLNDRLAKLRAGGAK
jgi:hypothetical protein